MEEETFYGGVEPVDVGNLEDVREVRPTVPAASDVVFNIQKAEFGNNNENTYRWLKLQLKIIDGIDVTEEDGTVVKKYVGKVLFKNVCYYADPNAYKSDYFKAKSRPYLFPLKQLRLATDTSNSVIDGHYPELIENKIVMGNIIEKKNKQTGDMENDVVNFKPVPQENLI